MPTHVVSPVTLQLHDFSTIMSKAGRLSLSPEAIQRINKCRAYLDEKIASTSTPLYGINTGFGSLYNKHISKDDLERLQLTPQRLAASPDRARVAGPDLAEGDRQGVLQAGPPHLDVVGVFGGLA